MLALVASQKDSQYESLFEERSRKIDIYYTYI